MIDETPQEESGLIQLTFEESRVLGCLLEKEATTPDHYPLTLNSIHSACNQSSNREPVTDLGTEEMEEELQSLREEVSSLRTELDELKSNLGV